MDGVVILLKLWLKTQRITYMRNITEIALTSRERDERKRETALLAFLMRRRASSYKRVGINFPGSRFDFIKLTEVPFRLYH